MTSAEIKLRWTPPTEPLIAQGSGESDYGDDIDDDDDDDDDHDDDDDGDVRFFILYIGKHHRLSTGASHGAPVDNEFS